MNQKDLQNETKHGWTNGLRKQGNFQGNSISINDPFPSLPPSHPKYVLPATHLSPGKLNYVTFGEQVCMIHKQSACAAAFLV